MIETASALSKSHSISSTGRKLTSSQEMSLIHSCTINSILQVEENDLFDEGKENEVNDFTEQNWHCTSPIERSRDPPFSTYVFHRKGYGWEFDSILATSKDKAPRESGINNHVLKNVPGM